ncbi:hypothetical protein HAX54_045960 [Datura stramonium]|uniref:Uncharacterized protein n=1 Tax=Datura stramonium TaxID=4076 RepID=A0ABS8SS97_DATST|nr:hypothetical protein [Datura stramonium]
MAKIILQYVVALLMIFPLFWNHGNAITPRKLGARHNAVTDLSNTNKITFRGSGGQYSLDSSSSVGSEHQDSHIPSLPTQTSVKTHHFHRFSSSQKLQPVQFEVLTPRKLWSSRHSGVTSLSNTNKAITSRASGLQHSSISSSSAHTHAIATTPRIQGARHNAVTSSSNANEETTGKDGTRQNPIIITSFSNTNKAITSRGSAIQYFPISSSSTHTYAIATTPRILGARHNAVTSSPKANGATTRKHGTRQNPIIITSLPNTNEPTNSRELELHFPPISRSPTQTNKVFPRDPDETGHVSSIIN